MNLTHHQTYTWTFFNATSAFASCAGYSSTDNAATPATNKATVVKKPKTPCALLRDECVSLIYTDTPV